ncbi:Tellurite resistance protein TerB [Pseudooceanicola marinus]|uniref:Tellurite resistance protein TerB n=1 Tax=Pseudooceanicola marinus TaxID=396013 RepID=A0A1X6Y6F8_9RHOB|nr:TerB family tellurite resistance protein [Pseudooceanicola marinus]PJE33395.1 TerB family tellurite resistance protein [Pseudooceanicola marinus]SLN10310.1 Tellurite resistance protein TerB [Pseudooceanicola marinus]
MFGDFLSRLTAPRPEPLNEGDARLALSALLVRVARADGTFDGGERRTIGRILETRYALDGDGAEALLRDAEALEGQAPDTVRFTRAIKDAVPYENRLAVVEALWQVVLADGNRDPEEDALLRLVVSLLGITDQDSARARQHAGTTEAPAADPDDTSSRPGPWS